MKVVVVGATGFIGAELVSQCCRKASISSVVAVTRRALPQEVSDQPKVRSVIIKDYNAISDEARNELKGASAAIWALRAPNYEVELDYPLAFVKLMSSLQDSSLTTFRYLHVSGVLAEKDQEKGLWFLQEGRRGQAELRLREFAHDKSRKGSWQTYIARPSMVLSNPTGFASSWMGWALGAIRVDHLAAAILDVVEKGADQETFENNDLVHRANELEI